MANGVIRVHLVGDAVAAYAGYARADAWFMSRLSGVNMLIGGMI